MTLFCANCGHAHRVVLHCGDRTCPHCRESEFWRLYNGYREAIKAKQNLKYVTLTLKNVPEGKLEEAVDRLRAGFKKLRRREPYASTWRGGIYAIEAIDKGNGWHVHMHLLIEGGFVREDQISADWLELTGDSFIVKANAVRNPEAVLWHSLKYMTKKPTLATIRNEAEYNLVLKGRRLIQTWGDWWGAVLLAPPPPLVCPRCGGTEWLDEFEVTQERFLAWQQGPPPHPPPD